MPGRSSRQASPHEATSKAGQAVTCHRETGSARMRLQLAKLRDHAGHWTTSGVGRELVDTLDNLNQRPQGALLPVPDPLTDDEIATALAEHPGWERIGDEITKTFGIEYHAGIRMIIEVAAAAREIGHHPDILRKWDTLAFTVTTHDAGYRLTVLDFDLAERIDAIAAKYGVTQA